MRNKRMSYRRARRTKALKRYAAMSVIKTMSIIAVVLMFGYPLLELDRNIQNAIQLETSYYEVSLNGELLGAVAEKEEAQEALKAARHEVVKAAGGLVYMEPVLGFTEKVSIFEARMTKEEIQESMVMGLYKIAEYPRQMAYAVKVDEHILYLKGEQEVLSLLEGVKNRIDLEHEFTVELVENSSAPDSALITNIIKPEMGPSGSTVVFASQDDISLAAAEVPVRRELMPAASTMGVGMDGVFSIEFEQNVEIVEAFVPSKQLTTVQDALDFLTKDKEENQIYEVVSGDCMSIIAEKNEMSLSRLFELNDKVSDDSILQIGQELIITIPEPELSVLAKEERTYEEDYQAPTEYIENDDWYTTEQVVRQDGTIGHHEVVAIISTRNGKEVERELIYETVMLESQPKVVERGTKTPPTYVWPTYGGRITSYYGPRWGRMHEGIDFGVSTGSTVVASSAGRVTSAGWNGGYGYCIVIQHPDGTQTLYAHLSKVLVSYGEYVDQGEKIALSGNTGNSTGPHLHFEIIVGGSPRNPLNYLD